MSQCNFSFQAAQTFELNVDNVDIVLEDLDVGHPTSLQPEHYL